MKVVSSQGLGFREKQEVSSQEIELSPNEKKVLIAVKDDCITPEKIAEKSGLEMVAVMSASSWLKSKGLVEIKEKISVFYSLDIDGKEYLKT
ncbi:MAG: hypothetical protein KJ655_02090, partial [Candidatus Thermoplasmatota archaeon]|nr:hypothetical protein [Candidatus Thermoplasmatota archaeon]